MKKVKTAKGRVIDMAAMVAANEAQRAVGNVRMNANGDRLDKGGKVVATVQRVARVQADAQQPVETAPISNPTQHKAAVKTAPKVEELKLASLQQKNYLHLTQEKSYERTISTRKQSIRNYG
jgi:hypothetical protein